MASTTSYNSEKAVIGEVEYPAIDPASGAFFQPDYKKNDDLKMMLDSSKDSLKLEAMKRIIGMIAKGRDASDLFPAVVKNVVSKNIEVKKLVYVYLVRYAEEQQDLALLSISTFQRALKDPNQLIRASALRVLSSIRVPMIVPIVMLAIRDSVSDMSPYVRKTAAHAIPKLYSLDPEQKEELVCVIEKLLADKAPLVVGSAAMAFSELCPERLPLLHKCFRKLCTLLADVDEWGQCALLDVLTEYSRAFLPDPNLQSQSTDSERSFYADSDSSADKHGSGGGSGGVDPELRLILRAAKPLLQSRSTAVVMAVAKLYFHCGPAQELPPVVKALIRLLRGPVEVQSVVLNAISALTAHKKGLFEPYLKSFFVRTSDPTHIKLLKLEVLSRLASASNISAVLAELRTYRAAGDKKLAAAAIRAVATAALAVPSETQTCLNSLLHLLSSKQEWAVCEAVLAVKRVVGAGSAAAAVRRACRLLRQDRVAGSARAAALWLVAEHGSLHPRAAAVLAHMARTFPDQEEVVKLQLLSLAGKLSVTQPDTLPLGRYLCQLSRYDTSYDVRDRGRMLSALLGRPALVTRHRHSTATANLPDHAEREQFTLGTLSQYLSRAAAGYRPLAEPHTDAIAAQLRAVGDEDTPITTTAPSASTANKDKQFYSEPESSGSGSSSSSSEDTSSGSEESSDEEESGNNDKKKSTKSKEENNYESSASSSSDSESSSSDSGSWPDSSEDDNKELANGDGKQTEPRPRDQKADKSNLELLLELDSAPALPAPALAPLTLFSPSGQDNGNTEIQPCPASYVSSTEKEVLSRVAGGGLSAAARWPRHAHLQSSRALALRLTLQNHTDDDITDIVVTAPDVVNSGRSFFGWGSVNMSARGVAHVTLGLDCADSIQPLRFTITSSLGETKFSITPPVGELMQAVSMSEATWDLHQSKLRGMNECDKKVSRVLSDATICQRVFETANVGSVTSTGTFLRFAGQMLSSGDLVLVSVLVKDDGLQLRVNCPNMAISSLMASQLAFAIDK